jgi:hypothetical protein
MPGNQSPSSAALRDVMFGDPIVAEWLKELFISVRRIPDHAERSQRGPHAE